MGKRIALLVALQWVMNASAAEPPRPAGTGLPKVREHRLANGMRWLIVERRDVPVFSAYVRVRVGGADERPGATGLAHLFEHMAFKGTPVLGTRDFPREQELLGQLAEVGDRLALLERSGRGGAPDAAALRKRLDELGRAHRQLIDENAFSTLYLENGAVGLNATTNKDVTSYFVSLPSNRVELWALLEASRLASPVLRDFYRERDVVLEERRTSIESSPAGVLREELNQLAFVMSPYRWPVVGYAEDLASMSLAEAQAFHERFYTPGNAVGCVVGDVNTEALLPLLERTFGAIPPAPPPPAAVFAEPPPRAARRSVVTFEAAPRLSIGFRVPPPPAADDDVLDVIQSILGSGRTSRLHRRLVLRDRLAQSISVGTLPGSRYERLLVVTALPMDGVPLAAVERAIWDELERLKRAPPTEAELQKVRNRAAADLARSIDSNEGLASTLSWAEAVVGDWRYTLEHPQRIGRVTASDVQRVAARLLDRTASVTVELQRPPKAGEGNP